MNWREYKWLNKEIRTGWDHHPAEGGTDLREADAQQSCLWKKQRISEKRSRIFLCTWGNGRIVVLIVRIFAAASTVFQVAGPKIRGRATTELANGLMRKINGTGGISFEKIAGILIVTLSLYLISALFNFVQGWLMTGITQKIVYKMRRDIAEKINRMPMKYFEKRPYGEVLSRITNDVDTLGSGLNQSVTMIITSIATIVGVVVMMLTISLLMTLITLTILPVSAILLSLIVKFSQKYFKDQQSYLGKVNGQVEEDFAGQQIIKAFNREDQAVETFEETNNILYKSAWKSQFISEPHAAADDVCRQPGIRGRY